MFKNFSLLIALGLLLSACFVTFADMRSENRKNIIMVHAGYSSAQVTQQWVIWLIMMVQNK